MLPKKYRELIAPTAEELQQPVDLVDSFVRFYYKELRLALSGMRAPLIGIDGIGKFRIKHWDLNEMEWIIQRGIQKQDVTRFQGFDRKAIMERKLEQIARMKQMVAEEKQRYEEHKVKRYGKKTL